jgi:hypothetical protein
MKLTRKEATPVIIARSSYLQFHYLRYESRVQFSSVVDVVFFKEEMYDTVELTFRICWNVTPRILVKYINISEEAAFHVFREAVS